MRTDMTGHQSKEPPTLGASAFLVGRDQEGHWLAVEAHGLGGGLFTTQEAALRYASFESGRRPGAVELVAGPIALRL